MRLFFKILTLLAAALIIVMSLRAATGTSSVQHLDKVMHLGCYGVLAGLARLGWWRVWGGWIFLICVTMGVGLEFAQAAMPLGRTGSLADAIANTLGVAIILIGFHYWRVRNPS